MERTVIVVAVVFLFIQLSTAYIPRFHNGRPRGGMLRHPASEKLPSDPLSPDMWMEQQLDHFNDADTRSWQQRYFVNNKFYKPGGPVFLMLGGEGALPARWMVDMMWIEYAKVYNAVCFMIEHRFYGKSHPTPDMSDENLEYLNSEQALADAAAFIEFAQVMYNIKDNRWIVFGASYAGALSAWLRMKYPHLVSGSVASSAPVLAQLNFKDYLGVVRDSLATTGPGCNEAIQQSTTAIQNRLDTQQGRDELKKLFNLCDDIDVENQNDIANLYKMLTLNFEIVVQSNKVNLRGELETSNITLDMLCDIMTDTSMQMPIERYAKVNYLLMTTQKEKCVNFVYSKMIDDMKQIAWNSTASLGGRQWTYQTCTEFGYFQSTDLNDQPFGHSVPLGFSIQQCMDIFGTKFTRNVISRGIKRTNANYGGLGIRVTNIVFPNGSIDPWHALGIREDLGPDAIAIYINGTAHCANMYPPRDSDSKQLVQARMTIQKLIGQWIQ